MQTQLQYWTIIYFQITEVALVKNVNAISLMILNMFIIIGLALLILTIIVSFFIVWDNFLAKFLTEKVFNKIPEVPEDSFLGKFGAWLF